MSQSTKQQTPNQLGVSSTLLLLLLAGCASPEGAGPLPLQSAPPFSSSGQTPPPSKWWTAFNAPELNRRIERALGENFSLAAAWERLRAAQAVADRRASDLWPDLDAVGSAEGTATTDNGNGDDEGNGDSDQTQSRLRLGLEASYELDLWGRIRSRAQAERLRASASLADYQAAAVSLSAEVARTWFQRVEARMQLELVEAQVQTNQTVLELLRTRFDAGQIRAADVLRQRQLVEATREQATAVRLRVDTLRHQLAVLQGQPPQVEREISGETLPELPPMPAAGLPADLLKRRPDVRRAYRLLQAADRDLAAAVSDQYPRISFSASVATAVEEPANLFREWIGSLAAQIIAPLFDAGQRRAEVERAAAVNRQRLAEYGQTVLIAFSEVEDALAGERRQLNRIRRIESQLSLARRVSEQLRTQYLNGVSDYVAVLDALTEQQRLQRDLLTARRALLEFRVALHRALAGAFSTPRQRQAEASMQDDPQEGAAP